MNEMGYYEMYHRVQPAIERYLGSHMIYPGQSLGEEQIDAMADEICNDITKNYPDMKDENMGNVAPAQRRRRGFLRTVVGLLLLQRLFGFGPFWPW